MDKITIEPIPPGPIPEDYPRITPEGAETYSEALDLWLYRVIAYYRRRAHTLDIDATIAASKGDPAEALRLRAKKNVYRLEADYLEAILEQTNQASPQASDPKELEAAFHRACKKST